MDEEVRDFLITTSVADALTGGLGDALTGRDDSGAMLRSLERANLFVVPLDDAGEWFRYHHLFADALRAQLTFRYPDRLSKLHGVAARWFAEKGMLADAIAHALAGADTEVLADLVELDIPQLRRDRQDRTLRRWLDSIPDDLARRRPLLAAFRAWARLSVGDLDGADDWLTIAEQASATPPSRLAFAASLRLELTAGRDAELRGLPSLIEVYRAAVAQARGDLTGTLAHARRGFELAPSDSPLSRGAAAGYLGLAAWAAGDLHTAIPTFTEAVDSLRQAGNTTDVLGATVVLSSMRLAQGRPDEAQRLCRQALADAERHAPVTLPVTGDLHVMLAGLLAEQGDDSGADEHLSTARTLGDAASLLENRYRWYTTMASVLQSRGDLDGAVTMLDVAQSLHLPGFFPDIQPIAATKARLRITQGRLEDAGEWARAHPLTADPAYQDEYARLTVARLNIAQFRQNREPQPLAAATRIASAVLSDAETADRPGSAVEALIVQSLIHHAHGSIADALTHLDRALTMGVPVGYARIFLDEGAPMVKLLQDIAARDQPSSNPYATQLLLIGTKPTTRHTAAGTGPEEKLSEREAQVLRLMSSTLSGPEIARRLYISVNTLRTHSKHLFTKLGVNTRRRAVQAGRAHGML